MISGRWEEMMITGQAIISQLISAIAPTSTRRLGSSKMTSFGLTACTFSCLEHVRFAPVLIPPEERRFWLTF